MQMRVHGIGRLGGNDHRLPRTPTSCRQPVLDRFTRPRQQPLRAVEEAVAAATEEMELAQVYTQTPTDSHTYSQDPESLAADAPPLQPRQEQQQPRKERKERQPRQERPPRQQAEGSGEQEEQERRNRTTIVCTLKSNVLRLAQEITSHPSMQPVQGSTLTPLRLVTTVPQAVPRAIQAVAEANALLISQDSPWRIKVSSSIKRELGSGLYDTLCGEQWKAFVFVGLVPAGSVPALDGGNGVIRVSGTSVWNKVSRYLQGTFEEGAETALMSCVGFNTLTIMYKSLMLARYNLVRGVTANSQRKAKPAGEAAQGTTDATTEADAAAPASSSTSGASGSSGSSGSSVAAAKPTMDFAFVPMVQKQVINSEKTLTVTQLHIFKCDPPAPSALPELRLLTPRPSRASSPRPDDRDANTERPPRRPRAPRSEAGAGEDAGTARPARPPRAARDNRAKNTSNGDSMVTVSVEEWRSMSARLESMAVKQAQLMNLLEATMPNRQGGGAGSGGEAAGATAQAVQQQQQEEGQQQVDAEAAAHPVADIGAPGGRGRLQPPRRRRCVVLNISEGQSRM